MWSVTQGQGSFILGRQELQSKSICCGLHSKAITQSLASTKKATPSRSVELNKVFPLEQLCMFSVRLKNDTAGRLKQASQQVKSWTVATIIE